MANLSDKVILTVAPTGAWPSKNDNPAVPLQPQEIADDVYACWKAGASVAHIHVRDDNDKSSMDYNKFVEAVKLIRATDCDIVLNLTTSGALGLEDEARMQHVIDLKPEIEVFDAGMIYNALHYLKKGILEAPLHFNLVLGAAGGIAATVENLVFMKSLLPADCTWSAFGIGKGHLPILYATLALGGHLRVGMEDNVLYAKGVLAESNAQFVERTKRIVKEFNKEIATPDETREILGLKR